MTVYEARSVLARDTSDKAKRLLEHIEKNGKVFPWVETEIRYLDFRIPVYTAGAVAVCRGGVLAEAVYNGTGGETDISFDQAVKIYENRQ